MTDIFVSYTTEDRERVRPLVEELQARGWSVWWDREITPGANFQRVISAAIAEAGCVVVGWSDRSVHSDWVANEANEGKEREVLVPVLLDEVRPPLGFRMDHAANLSDWRPGDSHPEFDALISAVEGLVGESARSAPERQPEPQTPSRLRRRHYYVLAATVVLLAGLALLFPERLADPLRNGEAASISELLSRPSVAVLPFGHLGSEANGAHLEIGMMYELGVGLRKMRAFPVLPANASLVFKDSTKTLPEIAAELNASYLVQGNVRESDGSLRVVASLIDARGQEVWVEAFERQTTQADLLGVVDELIAHITAAVRDSEILRVQRADRPPGDAWEHYLKAVETVVDWRPEKYAAASEHARRAIEIAPDMAEAWWAAAELDVFRYMESYHPPETAISELEPIIAQFRRAHELSPFHASACGCLGYLLTAVGREDEAKAVYEIAVEVNPLSADLHIDYAPHLLWTGRYDEAAEIARLGLRLDPISEDRATAWLVLAIVEFSEGNSERARQAVNRSLFIKRNHFASPAAIPLLYLLGDVDQARRELAQQIIEIPGFDPQNPLTYVMLKPLNDLLTRRRSRGDLELPESVAVIFSELGWSSPSGP